jgi:hypothetical protein
MVGFRKLIQRVSLHKHRFIPTSNVLPFGLAVQTFFIIQLFQGHLVLPNKDMFTPTNSLTVVAVAFPYISSLLNV